MGKDLNEWLAGYHFFRQQYVARNSQYIPLADQFFYLEDEFLQLDIKNWSFRGLVNDVMFCSENKTINKFNIEQFILSRFYADDLDKHAVDILARAVIIQRHIEKIGGEIWTEYGDDPSELLERIGNGELFYWTIPELSDSYNVKKGSVLLPINAMENIQLKEQKGLRQAICTINLDESLDDQFNTIMRMLNLVTMTDKNGRIDDLHRLEDRSRIIEYDEIVKKNIVSYNNSGDKARCIGLWLWDRVKELGEVRGAKTRAIAEFELLPNFNEFGLGDNPDYYHWLRRTEACIEAAEVLTFDKKNPESKKRKCPSGTRKRK